MELQHVIHHLQSVLLLRGSSLLSDCVSTRVVFVAGGTGDVSQIKYHSAQHITPTLRDTSHWLPVVQRIHYKVAVTTFNCIRGTLSAYFRDICYPLASVDARARLHSADHGDLVEPRTNTKPYMVLLTVSASLLGP